jgi:putative membrane protein
MRFLVWIIVNVAALGAATWLFDGITLTAANQGDQIVALVVVGAIFGVINSFVSPIVKLLSLPFVILTLGLLLLVINAAALLLTSKIADSLGIGFHVDGFWTAVLGAIVISIVSAVVGAVLPDRKA